MSTTMLLTAAGLLSLASALPTTSSSAPLEARWQHCPTGTWYSQCPDGVSGCFSYDPCNQWRSPSTNPPHNPPTPEIPPHQAPAPNAPTLHQIANPHMFNLYFLQGTNANQDPTSHLDVVNTNRRNLAVFDKIPAEAKNCHLRWRQSADMKKRTLNTYDNSGLVYTRQLSDFPAADVPVIEPNLEQFVIPGSEWTAGMDFANWREVEGAQEHMGPSMTCDGSGIVVVQLSANFDAESEAHVYIANDDENGLYLEYTL